MSSLYQGDDDKRANTETHAWYATPFGERYLSHDEAEDIARNHNGDAVRKLDGPTARGTATKPTAKIVDK